MAAVQFVSVNGCVSELSTTLAPFLVLFHLSLDSKVVLQPHVWNCTVLHRAKNIALYFGVMHWRANYPRIPRHQRRQSVLITK